MTLCAALALSQLTASAADTASAAGAASAPVFTLTSQTQWVTPEAPWYSLALGVGPAAGAASDLHVAVTFYSRITDGSQLQEATNATPDLDVLTRVTSIPVTEESGTMTAATCVTVLPRNATAPTASPAGACPAGAPTVNLPCSLESGPCDDVYPVSVALIRSGQSAPVLALHHIHDVRGARIRHRTSDRRTAPVSWIVPGRGPRNRAFGPAEAARSATETLIGDLAAHRSVATTLEVSPVRPTTWPPTGARPANTLRTSSATD